MKQHFSSAKLHYLPTNRLGSDIDSEIDEKDEKHKNSFRVVSLFLQFWPRIARRILRQVYRCNFLFLCTLVFVKPRMTRRIFRQVYRCNFLFSCTLVFVKPRTFVNCAKLMMFFIASREIIWIFLHASRGNYNFGRRPIILYQISDNFCALAHPYVGADVAGAASLQEGGVIIRTQIFNNRASSHTTEQILHK